MTASRRRGDEAMMRRVRNMQKFLDAQALDSGFLDVPGEVPIPGIDTEFLCNKIREAGAEVTFVQDMNAIPEHLMAAHDDAGMVIFFGGDDLFAMADAYTRKLVEGGD